MGDGAGGEAPWILSAFSRERGGICPARSVLRRTASSSRKETCQNGGAPVRACLASLERLRECEDLRGRRKRTTDTGSAGTKQPWSEAAGSRAAIQACCIEFFIPCTSPPRRASILHYGVELWTRPEPVQEGDVGIHAYASQCERIGAELKTVPADFVRDPNPPSLREDLPGSGQIREGFARSRANRGGKPWGSRGSLRAYERGSR